MMFDVPGTPLELRQGEHVSLKEVLQARDERVQRQQILKERWGKTVVSLTLVTPGPIKRSEGALFVFRVALQAFQNFCEQQEWIVLEYVEHSGSTGYEAQFALNVTCARMVKRRLLILEEEHFLGRLWDFDVIDDQGGVSRQTLGIKARKCLVCDDVAHACVRSKKHSLDEIYGVMQGLIRKYIDRTL